MGNIRQIRRREATNIICKNVGDFVGDITNNRKCVKIAFKGGLWLPLNIKLTFYQSEADLEREMIKHLWQQGYEHVDIKQESQLIDNLRLHIKLIDKGDIHHNYTQVINQYEVADSSLILPMVISNKNIIYGNYRACFKPVKEA